MWQLQQIAEALGAEWAGAGDLAISGTAEPATAQAGDLALALSPAWAGALADGQAQAAILWPGADWQALGLKAAIFAPRGRLAMAKLTQMMDPGPQVAVGIHPSAVIEGELGPNCAIGPFVHVGRGAKIGAGSRLSSNVTIAAGAVIGENATLLSGVRVGPNVVIGRNIIVQPNAVIGGDGFSFVTETPAHVEVARKTLGEGELTVPADPRWHRIHSLGGVVIGDDVEIGANATVDAGTIRPTRIGNGTKIDNLCQIGHNVVIGEHCLFASQSAVAGSTVIGDRVVAGGRSGIADNLKIGDDVVLGGGSVVLSNVPAGRVMMGYPAMPMPAHVESYKALRRLPRILKRLAGDTRVPNKGEAE